MNAKYLFAAALLAVTGCSGGDDNTAEGSRPADESAAVSNTEVAALRDGALRPGRYRHVVTADCEGVTDDPIACPAGSPAHPPVGIDVTVPEGWSGSREFNLLEPTGSDTSGPDGAALVMGWTTYTVGLNSDPCLSQAHEIPDIKVGPSVDDFVDAVQARKRLNVTKPTDVELGGYSGRFFTLKGPADVSTCDNWRPWDPSPYAQGDNNIWDLWVMDVDGQRVVVMAEYFPDTPSHVKAELHEMAESVGFEPNL